MGKDARRLTYEKEIPPFIFFFNDQLTVHSSSGVKSFSIELFQNLPSSPGKTPAIRSKARRCHLSAFLNVDFLDFNQDAFSDATAAETISRFASDLESANLLVSVLMWLNSGTRENRFRSDI